MPIQVDPRVFDDLTDALVWYYERNEEAAERFRSVFLATVRHIAEFPSSGPLWDGLRRYRLRGFPYSLWFDPESGVVVALWHDARDPAERSERDLD